MNNNEITPTEENVGKNKLKSLLTRFGKGIGHFFCNAPKVCIGFFIAAAVAAVLHILSSLFPAFADFMIKYPCAGFRFIAAKLTMWIPFSLAEMLVILLPVIFISLIVCGIIVSTKGSQKQYISMTAGLLSAISFFYISFVFTLAPGYKGSSLDKKLGLPAEKVSAKELYDTASYLTEKINAIIGSVGFAPDGSSVMPYDLDELNDKLNDAYKKASAKYSFISPLRSNLKYVIMSEPMSYTHITGVYTYFTGESNINVNFPDYTIPYTAAHELAHQRGIARENEANFVAFLASLESDDSYILYSAYTNMLEYVLNALSTADSELYNSLWSKFDRNTVKEFNAYSLFFKKYQHSTASTISSAINNSYLQSQGVKEGSRSYGLVVDLTVAYCKTLSE